MIVVVVLGGMGNPWGPPVGAIIVVVLSEFLRTTLGEAHLLVYAALMIVIVVFLPDGLVGWLARLSARWVSSRGTTAPVAESVPAAMAPSGLIRAGWDGHASHDVTGLPPHRITHLGVARTFQIVRPLKKMTVLDNALTAALANTVHVGAAREAAEEILRFVELSHRRHTLAASLTLEERKRLELARALATRPKLLLLDEVAAGLNDTETKTMVGILERIRETGIAVVAVEYVMQVIMSISDRVVVPNYGQVLAEGKPAEVAQDPFNTAILSYREIELIGVRAYDPKTWHRSYDVLGSRQFPLEDLVTHRLPLEEAGRGIELMTSRQGLKIMFTPNWV